MQACSLSINGSDLRSFFVFSSYAFREASKIAFKLEEEELEAVGVVFDMAVATRRGLGCACTTVAIRVRVD